MVNIGGEGKQEMKRKGKDEGMEGGKEERRERKREPRSSLPFLPLVLPFSLCLWFELIRIDFLIMHGLLSEDSVI